MSDDTKRDAATDLAVCAAATKGPYGECHTSKSPHWQVYSECKENDCIHSGEWVGSFGAAEDAKFTLTAITALPHWIERATAAEEKLRGLAGLIVEYQAVGTDVERLQAYLVEASEARYDWEAKAKAAEVEVARLRQCCDKQDHDIQQILGAVLRYPRYCDDQKNFPGATEANGVCTGEHTAETIAEEAAEVIQRLRRQRDNWIERATAAEAEVERLRQCCDKLLAGCQEGYAATFTPDSASDFESDERVRQIISDAIDAYEAARAAKGGAS